MSTDPTTNLLGRTIGGELYAAGTVDCTRLSRASRSANDDDVLSGSALDGADTVGRPGHDLDAATFAILAGRRGPREAAVLDREARQRRARPAVPPSGGRPRRSPDRRAAGSGDRPPGRTRSATHTASHVPVSSQRTVKSPSGPSVIVYASGSMSVAPPSQALEDETTVGRRRSTCRRRTAATVPSHATAQRAGRIHGGTPRRRGQDRLGTRRGIDREQDGGDDGCGTRRSASGLAVASGSADASTTVTAWPRRDCRRRGRRPRSRTRSRGRIVTAFASRIADAPDVDVGARRPIGRTRREREPRRRPARRRRHRRRPSRR